MTNVINLKPRQRVRLRLWSYYIAAGVTGGTCGSLLLAWLWPQLYHPVMAFGAPALALVANSVAAAFCVQAVRSRRLATRQIREFQAAEAARSREWAAADTVVIPILRPRRGTTYVPYVPRDEPHPVLEAGMRQRLWLDLTERTGDIATVDWSTPPRGWRAGAA